MPKDLAALDAIIAEANASNPQTEEEAAEQFKQEAVEDEAVEWIDEFLTALPPVEKIARALPEGLSLCPMCLGQMIVPSDPPFDPHIHACTNCQGYGTVRTGSLVGEHSLRPCTVCQGKGYMADEAGTVASTPASTLNVVPGVTPRDYMGRTPDQEGFDWARLVEPPMTVPEVKLEEWQAAVPAG